MVLDPGLQSWRAGRILVSASQRRQGLCCCSALVVISAPVPSEACNRADSINNNPFSHLQGKAHHMHIVDVITCYSVSTVKVGAAGIEVFLLYDIISRRASVKSCPECITLPSWGSLRLHKAGAAQHRRRSWRSTAHKARVAHWRSTAHIDAETYFHSSTDMPDWHVQKTTSTVA